MALADGEMLTVAEVAELLKLNQQTVRNWLDAGRLPAVRVGRRVRIQRSALEEFIGVELSPGATTPEPEAELLTPSISRGLLAEALEGVIDRQAAAVALDQIAAGCSALAASLRGRS